MDTEYRRQFTKAVWKKVCVLFDIFVSALEFGAWDGDRLVRIWRYGFKYIL